MEKITTLISDLDGCMWDGTLAEKQKVKLNTDYVDELKRLYAKGIQIFIVSKNDYNDVINTFHSLGINKNLFTHIIANWEPKYLNIEKLLNQTNIRPETVIFIDDNYLELDEVELKMPLIKCIHFSTWGKKLKNKYFEKLEYQSTFEIQERVNRYKTAIKSSELRDSISEDKSFLKLLNRKIAIGEITSDSEIKRFAKLLTLTHRINFNPDKFLTFDDALEDIIQKGKLGYKLIGVSVWESNLSLGLSGGFLLKIHDGSAEIEDATFSCGIIGRDFEQRAIIVLINSLKKIGIEQVIITVRKTSTNVRVAQILNELEFQKISINNVTEKYLININDFKPVNSYEWIELIETPSFTEHFGIPSVIDFFNDKVKPIIKKGNSIINLGSANGEVLGHLKQDKKQEFIDFINKNEIKLTKVDLVYIPEEKNDIGNAENLINIKSERFNLVMAIELLEHTQHFWMVINEMIRICKVGGYILITVPANNYPKHEYPIDLWRIGGVTLLSFFPEDYFKIVRFETEGDSKFPRRIMLLAQKKKKYNNIHKLPKNGKTDWKTGITYFE